MRWFPEASLLFSVAALVLVAEARGLAGGFGAGGPWATQAGWDRYLDILEVKYIPPEQAGGAQEFRLKFNISINIPKGTKITFHLESGASVVDTKDYVLKTENRKSLVMPWKPKIRLTTGDYYFRVRMPLSEQVPAVRRIIRSQPERFPPDGEPWACYYADPKHVLHVGSLEDEEFERREICRIYSDFTDRLIDSLKGFLDKMKLVEDGQEMVSSGSLDRKAFESQILRWRKEQGEIQKDITLFQVKEPGIFRKTKTAYLNLLELARMVSKRSWQVQQAVEKQYGLKGTINPPSHPYFDRNYRFAVNPQALNERLEKMLRLACGRKAEDAPAGDAEAAVEAQSQEERAAITKVEDSHSEKQASAGKRGEENATKKKRPSVGP